MSKVFAVANQKGGVAKTTSTRNLGAALAARGRKVLIVDLDPQGHLTLSFGVDPLKLDKHAYHLMIDEEVTIASILVYHHASGVGLVPTNLDLSGAEIELLVGVHGAMEQKSGLGVSVRKSIRCTDPFTLYALKY